MNKDIAQGKWKQMKGKLREQWGRLTDDDFDKVEGRYDRLVGLIQEKYGHGKDDASREVDQFLDGQSTLDRERPTR